MDKKPLISLIVPVYNAEKYLTQCIEGILNQSYHNIEIILVNDGSTDMSSEICEEYAKRDSRIRVLHKENQGASLARNLGIEVAHGDFVAFVDADDYIFPDYIEYLYRLLDDTNADISVAACVKVNGDKKKTADTVNRGTDNVECYTCRQAIENLLYRKGITGYPVAKLFKREFIKGEVFPENITYGEDFIFIFRILKKISRVVWGKRIIYIYYQHADSVNHGKVDSKKYRDSWEAFEKEFSEDVKEKTDLGKAWNAKAMIYALDFCTRLVRVRQAEKFVQKLKDIIKMFSKEVWHDKKAKKSNRIIALLCSMNVTITIWLCYIFLRIKSKLKWEVQKPL